jgi:hypothetical protein
MRSDCVEYEMNILKAGQVGRAADDQRVRAQTTNPPMAANDNQLVWPLVPFPEGWYAAA